MKKTVIVYGKAETDIQKKALEMFSRLVLEYTAEYPALYTASEYTEKENERAIFIGKREDHPCLSVMEEMPPAYAESYRITVKNDTVYIEGSDDVGTLYGCMDFFDRYLIDLEYPNTELYQVNPFENPFPDRSFSSYPKVRNRGLWTWGHVLYDYQGYFDHMLRLKLNTVTIWNDRVPLNAKEMIDYAHRCGIKVIFGYSWLWTTDCKSVPLDQLCDFSQSIFDQYEKEYSSLGADGIYFQSATELSAEKIGDIIIADAVTSFVNHTANLFFRKYPNLELQFGLHATSVKNKLSYIQKTDPRIRIVWEDCGAFPFHYLPSEIQDFEKTKRFVQNIATLRAENDCFGVVTKGLTKLDWFTFEHPDHPLWIGVGTKNFYANRTERKRKIWKYLQAYWIANADQAQEMVRLMAKIKKGDLYISALVEDGMFEQTVFYPVALYAEMLWDAERDIKELITKTALRTYVAFA